MSVQQLWHYHDMQTGDHRLASLEDVMTDLVQIADGLDQSQPGNRQLRDHLVAAIDNLCVGNIPLAQHFLLREGLDLTPTQQVTL